LSLVFDPAFDHDHGVEPGPDPNGYDAGKKIKGKKRHILVDALGLLICAVSHPANIQDPDDGVLVLEALFDWFPLLRWRLSGTKDPRRSQTGQTAIEGRDRQAVRRRLHIAAKALDGGANVRLVGPLRETGKGFRVFVTERAGVSRLGIDPAHAAPALQGRMNFPDGL